MGMTDKQFQCMLLDMRQQWNEVLKLAEKAGAEEVVAKVQEQIALIDQKLKF